MGKLALKLFVLTVVGGGGWGVLMAFVLPDPYRLGVCMVGGFAIGLFGSLWIIHRDGYFN